MHAVEAGLAARGGALPGARRGGAAHAREGVKSSGLYSFAAGGLPRMV